MMIWADDLSLPIFGISIGAWGWVSRAVVRPVKTPVGTLRELCLRFWIMLMEDTEWLPGILLGLSLHGSFRLLLSGSTRPVEREKGKAFSAVRMLLS